VILTFSETGNSIPKNVLVPRRNFWRLKKSTANLSAKKFEGLKNSDRRGKFSVPTVKKPPVLKDRAKIWRSSPQIKKN
jgi:hypothetical protein